jgi:MoaA/NifB/PqqE/SkfB family radical SAM enzyme
MSRYLAEKQENPLLLHLEITTRCNLRCARCGHAVDPPHSLRIAPRHLQYSIIETFDPFFAAAARVHTGERLKHYECMVDGISNGVLVGEKEVDWLGYDEITFSIDGVEPATMQRLRAGRYQHSFVDLQDIQRVLA